MSSEGRGTLDPALFVGWRLLLDAMPEAVALVGPDGRIVFANAQLTDLTRHGRGDLDGVAVAELVPAASRGRHDGYVDRFRKDPLRRAMGAGRDTACVRADGSSFAADIAIAPLVLGDETYVLCTLRDDSERVAREQRLFHDAVHDALTGLPNRALLADRVGMAVRRSERSGTPVTEFFVDVDDFKAVNDTYGHEAGDAVLRAVAGALVSAARQADTVARLGGDEFVVLCEGLTPKAAGEMAARMLDAVRAASPAEGAKVTVSVGFASTSTPTDVPELVRRADAAMYVAKAAGGDRAVLDD